MKLLNTSYIEIKKSKFYGYLYELDSIEDVKIILNNLKEENKGWQNSRKRKQVHLYKRYALSTYTRNGTG